MFKIRDEVEPTFTIEKIGDIYIIDDILHTTYPVMFLGYSPKLKKMYTFNCSDKGNGYVEYIVLETTFDIIKRSNNRTLDAINFMKEADKNEGLYILILGIRDSLFMRAKFDDLEELYIPKEGTYFKYDKEKINRIKSS